MLSVCVIMASAVWHTCLTTLCRQAEAEERVKNLEIAKKHGDAGSLEEYLELARAARDWQVKLIPDTGICYSEPQVLGALGEQADLPQQVGQRLLGGQAVPRVGHGYTALCHEPW